MAIVTCRFRQFIHENGTVLCWGQEEQRPGIDPDGLCTTAILRRGGGQYLFALVRAEAQAIGRRLPYDEDSYLEKVEGDGCFGGSGTVKNVSSKKDLIRAIVALNKQIHETSATGNHVGGSYRWSFGSLEGLELPPIPAELPAAAQGRRGAIHLKSVNLWSVAENLHSVSEGTIRISESYASKFRIGFAGRPRQ